jgi:hypothetical protein
MPQIKYLLQMNPNRIPLEIRGEYNNWSTNLQGEGQQQQLN